MSVWRCPVIGHTDGSAPRSGRPPTVEWIDGVACRGECCGPGQCSCSWLEDSV